jgi:hypothetical protein
MPRLLRIADNSRCQRTIISGLATRELSRGGSNRNAVYDPQLARYSAI